MKDFQYEFFILALLAVIFMMLIGIFIAEKNLTWAFISFIATIVTIAVGFIWKAKKKKRA